MPGMFDLSGETALVTGASRGIGAVVADVLADAGARVIGTATTADGASRITERMSTGGRSGRGIVLDVSQAGAAQAALDATQGESGPVTILVNNAGITRDNLVMRMKDEEWDSVLTTNLSSAFRLSRVFLKGMLKARRGRIINIASVVGAMGNAGQANYAAAKAGMVGLSKSLAREVGSRGITVNVVAPGYIATDMTAGLGDDHRQALLAQVPLQRLGTPEDIAAAVLFLASPGAGYITGETLHVNGGIYMI